MTHVVDTQAEMSLARPIQPIEPSIIEAQPDLLQAINLCVQMSGLTNHKAIAGRLGIEPAQWSKILSGKFHFPTDKYGALMDLCGNEAPLMFLIHSRGYDITSLRKLETETEREKRLLAEENEALRRENEIMRGLIKS